MLDEEQIAKLTKLAKLDVPKKKQPQLQNDLNAILEMVEKITPLEIGDVAPLYHPLDRLQPLRNDEAVSNNISKSTIQTSASKVENSLYIVPKVID